MLALAFACSFYISFLGIVFGIKAKNTAADALAAKASKVAPITVRASITVVSAVPIMIVYPFLQKYFVTGMALGSVKG